MKLRKRLLVSIGLLIVNLGCVLGSTTDSKDAKSFANVLSPISIENTDGQGLNFGVIALGSTNSIIRVSATSTVSSNVFDGDAVILNAVTQTAAKFTVSGEQGCSFIVNLPTSMAISDGTHSLTINNFKSSNNGSGTINLSTIFYVGADLLVPSNATIGYYHGTFNVIVSYN